MCGNFYGKRIIRKSIGIFNQSTSFLREPPDFLIMGSARCGKTSLYNYLLQSTEIFQNFRNETSFFDINYDRGLSWYKSNFPTKIYKKFLNQSNNGLVGEVIHINSPHIPKRLKKVNSNPKIIVVLRNPTDRAYSHFLMSKRLKDEEENTIFEDVLDQENIRINLAKKNNETIFDIHQRQWFLYKTNGIYINNLKEWWKFFPKKEMLFLKSEDLFYNTEDVVNTTLQFLGLNQLEKLKKIDNFHDKNEEMINSDTRNHLIEFFKPYNEKLYSEIGINFEWDK